MKRLLSSRFTFFWKAVFPLVWSGLFGFVTYALFTRPASSFKTGTGTPTPPAPLNLIKWEFLVSWIFGTLFILWLCLPLKRVFIENGKLLVSNYFSEAAIPLADIIAARENRRVHIGSSHPIIIELRVPSVYGKRIVFIPNGKAPFSWPWQRKLHPVVEELQGMAAHNASVAQQRDSPFS